MVGRLGQYLRLIRPYGMLFLGLAPMFGAVANGETRLPVLIALFFIGALYHVFTFVHNDIIDMEVDARSQYVAARPLVQGGISRRSAWMIAASAVVLLLILTVLLDSLWTYLLVLGALVCVFVYNLWSKRLPFAEYVLGAGVLSVSLAGAMAVTPSVSVLSWLVVGSFFLQWVFSVGISANLKDVEEDTKNQVFTSPTQFGARFADGKVLVPRSFQIYAFGISVGYLIILGLPFVLRYVAASVQGFYWPVVGYALLFGCLMVTTGVLMRGPSSSRDQFLRYAGVHEGLALLVEPFVLMSLLLIAVGVPGTVRFLGASSSGHSPGSASYTAPV